MDFFSIEMCSLNHKKFDRIQEGRKNKKRATQLKQSVRKTKEI